MRKLLVSATLLALFCGVSFAGQKAQNNEDPPIFRNGPSAVATSLGSNVNGKNLQNVWAIRPQLRALGGPIGDPPIFKNGPSAVATSLGSNVNGKNLQNVWAIRPQLRTLGGPIGDPPVFKNGPSAVATSLGSNVNGKNLQNVWEIRPAVRTTGGPVGDPPIFKNGPSAVAIGLGSNVNGKHLQNVFASRGRLFSALASPSARLGGFTVSVAPAVRSLGRPGAIAVRPGFAATQIRGRAR